MCRNIVQLRSADAPHSRAAMEAAALQYVRKVSGFRQPSRANQDVFYASVARIADATDDLLSSLAVRSLRD